MFTSNDWGAWFEDQIRDARKDRPTIEVDRLRVRVDLLRSFDTAPDRPQPRSAIPPIDRRVSEEDAETLRTLGHFIPACLFNVSITYAFYALLAPLSIYRLLPP